jgi:HEPN domain
MSAAQNLQVQILFIKSAEDEATIAFPIPDATFEFHVQQAIEKLLKALITARGAIYPYTHDLQLLLNQLAALGETLPNFSVATNDVYAVWSIRALRPGCSSHGGRAPGIPRGGGRSSGRCEGEGRFAAVVQPRFYRTALQ